MNATRRKVLQALGLTPVAAPLAAKAAADAAIAEMTGISQGALGGNISGSTLGAVGINAIQGSSQDSWTARVMRFLAERTLPAWVDDVLRARHQQVSFLDPDIASKRAWSMNVKIVAQRERNIERARREIFSGPERNMRMQEFSEKYGVWF